MRVVIDDFGTGYFSLSHLRQFPVDALKIASEFVQVDEDDSRSATLAGAIVALGESLGIATVAEGIETREQAERHAGAWLHVRPGLLLREADRCRGDHGGSRRTCGRAALGVGGDSHASPPPASAAAQRRRTAKRRLTASANELPARVMWAAVRATTRAERRIG